MRLFAFLLPFAAAIAILVGSPPKQVHATPSPFLVSQFEECRPDGMGGGRLYSVAVFSDGFRSEFFLGPCTPSTGGGSSHSMVSMMENIKHFTAGSLNWTGGRTSDRLIISGLAQNNEFVQIGQAGDEDDDSDTLSFILLAAALGNSGEPIAEAESRAETELEEDSPFLARFTPAEEGRFLRRFAAVDRNLEQRPRIQTTGFSRFASPRFDGITTDANVRGIRIDNAFADTEVVDFQSDTFATYSLASRIQVQAGLLNTYTEVEVQGGGELDVWRSQLYGSVFVGLQPWLWWDGQAAIGFADFDANAAANAVDETSLLVSTNTGLTVVAAVPDFPWVATGRVGVNFLHVGTTPDEVNQTRLDITARVGRSFEWGAGGGFYVGYTGSTAISNPAVPNQDWTNQVEAGVVFVLPNLGLLRLSGDALVGDANVDNYSGKLTFHLFPNRS